MRTAADPKGKLLFYTALLFLFVNAANAQTGSGPGLWTMIFGQLKVHERWSIHAEIQNRDYSVFDQPEQILLRTGVNFHYSGAMLTAGYAHITNYPHDDEVFQSPQVSENRAWQQIFLKQQAHRFFIEHRYRLEQRWIDGPASRYLNRVRYMLRVSIPLNKKSMDNNTLYLSCYDEIFLHLTRNPFDRNRLYGSLGYKFNSVVNLQLGYLAQTTNANTNHYLQAALFYQPDLRKKEN